MNKKMLVSLLMVAFVGSTYTKNDKCLTKYIQAGAQPGGNGSQNKPFNKLEDAQNARWKKLIVLPSKVALGGTLELKPCQKVIGAGNTPEEQLFMPTGQDFAVITCNGKNTIANIHIKDAWAAAIDVTNGTDVCVENVLVTGHNKSETTYRDWVTGGDLPNTFGLSYLVAAISSFAEMSDTEKASGKITVYKCVVLDGSGSGLIIAARSAWQVPDATLLTRDVCVKNSRFENLINTSLGIMVGIFVFTDGENACATLKVLESVIDTISADDPSLAVDAGISILTTTRGAFQNIPLVLIKKSIIRNINTGPSTDRTAINYTLSNPGSTSTQCLTVHHNIIDKAFVGVRIFPTSRAPDRIGPVCADIKENTLTNLSNSGVRGTINATVDLQACIANNTFENIGNALVELINVSGPAERPSVDAVIRGNRANNFRTALRLGAFDDEEDIGPWSPLNVCLECNCFRNGQFGISENTKTIEPSTIVVDAGCGAFNSRGKNSWVDIATDVSIDEANVVARKNWWGTPAGPQVVIISGGGSFEAEPFLSEDPNDCGSNTPTVQEESLVQEEDSSPLNELSTQEATPPAKKGILSKIASVIVNFFSSEDD